MNDKRNKQQIKKKNVFIKTHVSQVLIEQWAKDEEVLFFFNRQRNINGEYTYEKVVKRTYN